jgi:hypothetical protein
MRYRLGTAACASLPLANNVKEQPVRDGAYKLAAEASQQKAPTLVGIFRYGRRRTRCALQRWTSTGFRRAAEAASTPI